MRIPVVGMQIDERFLNHRLRSTSLAGIVGGLVAICLVLYRFYVNHRLSWDLIAVIATILLVKFSVLAWYRLTD